MSPFLESLCFWCRLVSDPYSSVKVGATLKIHSCLSVSLVLRHFPPQPVRLNLPARWGWAVLSGVIVGLVHFSLAYPPIC